MDFGDDARVPLYVVDTSALHLPLMLEADMVADHWERRQILFAEIDCALGVRRLQIDARPVPHAPLADACLPRTCPERGMIRLLYA